MRRLIALLAVAALVLTASAAAADFQLRVVSQTATTITLGWDARSNVVNYTFYANGNRVSNSYNGNLTQVTFGKVANCTTPCYVVQSLVSDGQGGYPTAPPPPVDVCPNIPGDQATIPDGMIKDANGNCVTPPPPPSGNTLTVTDRTWRCSGPVNYDLVKITISGNVGRTDGAVLGSGCTGRIGRIEIDTANADGIHIGAFAHDLQIDGGYVHSTGVCSSCGDVHVDGIQALGGQRITLRNLDINYPTATNSAFYFNTGSGGQDRPTDIVCDGCTIRRGVDRNRVVRIYNSTRSGVRNSTVYYCGDRPQCSAGGRNAPAIDISSGATDPVNVNNRLILT